MCTHSLLQPCNEVVPVFILLQASEGHFRARDILHSVRQDPMSITGHGRKQWTTRECPHLFRVLEVLEQRFLVPSHALVDVGGGIREALDRTASAAQEPETQVPSMTLRPVPDRTTLVDIPMQIWADFVGFSRADGMTLRAPCFEETGALGGITCRETHSEGDVRSGRCRSRVRVFENVCYVPGAKGMTTD